MAEEKVPNNWKVPAKNFVSTMMVNVDNDKLTDAEFRDIFRNTLPIVEKSDFEDIVNEEIKPRVRKYYE